MDYFRRIRRQEDITDIIEIEITNNSEYERNLEEIPTIISNNLKTVDVVSPINSSQYIKAYGNNEFPKFVKLLRNFIYKYEIKIKINHTIYPKLSSKTTNCNSISELIVNFGTRSKRPKDNRYFNRDVSEKLLKLIGSYRFNKSIGRKLVISKRVFHELFDIDPRYKIGKKKYDRYMKILQDFNVEVDFSPIKISRVRMNLFNAGYPLIEKSIADDWMSEYRLIKYMNLKLISEENLKIYNKIRKGLGL